MKGKGNDKLLSGLFFRLLPYQVLLLMINAANGIVDSLFASNFVGKTAMSAIGFYSPLNHFLFALSVMLVSGSQLLVGKAMGKNDMDSVHRLFSTDLLLSLGISLATSALLVLGAVTDLTRVMAQDDTERLALNRYILGQAVGIPALVLGQQLFSFLSMENQRRRTTVASLACVVSNALMNTLLVGVLKLDTLGLGLGSSIGLWVFCGVMAHYYLTHRSGMKLAPRTFSWKDSLSICRLGYSGALSRFVEMFRCLIVNALIMACVGSAGLSAFAAVNSLMGVFWPIPFGMVSVTRMLLGISIGEEDRRSVADIMRIAFRKCLLLQCGVTAVMVLLAGPFTSMFYRDPSDPVFQMTLTGLRMMPLCMPLSVISLCFACYAQAMENKFMSNVLPLTDGMIGVVLFSLMLIPQMRMNGLYLANILNGVLCLVLILAYAAVRKKRFPKDMEDLLVLPDSFGAKEDARIDIEISDMSQVTEVSDRVIDFCLARGVDLRRARLAGLAMEEMAGNVVEHGFSADSGSHYINIRVVHKEDDIILRLRDNCAAFDPLDRAKVLDPDDLVSNIGLRIVLSITRDVRYQNLLGLNVLTLRI